MDYFLVIDDDLNRNDPMYRLLKGGCTYDESSFWDWVRSMRDSQFGHFEFEEGSLESVTKSLKKCGWLVFKLVTSV